MRRFAVLLASVLALAGSRAAASAGARALNLPLSVRQLGMGDVSIGGADVLRAWSNPALLTDQDRQGEIAMIGSSLLGNGATAEGLGGSWKVSPEWSVGGLLSMFSTEFSQIDATGVQTGQSLTQKSTSLGVASAYRFDLISVGGTVKLVSDSVMSDAVTTAGFDLGAALDWQDLTAGFALRNVGGTLRPAPVDGVSSDGLPFEYRVGAAYHYRPLRLTGGVEFVQASDTDPRLNLGVEWWVVDILALRAGVAGLQSSPQLQPTFGLSAAYHGLGLDYALGSHPLGPTHRFSLSYAFGAGGEARAEPAVAAAPPEPAKPVAKALKSVTVATFVSANVASGDAEAITNLLRSQLGEYETIRTVFGPKDTGCVSLECATKIGRKAKANFVVVGTLDKVMDRFFIKASLVDVARSRVVGYEDIKGDNVDQLEAGLKKFAIRIEKTLR